MPLPSLSPRGANVSHSVVLPVQTVLKPQQLVVLARKAPDQTSKLDLRDPQGDREMDQEGVLSLVLVDRHYGHTEAGRVGGGVGEGRGLGVRGLLEARAFVSSRAALACTYLSAFCHRPMKPLTVLAFARDRATASLAGGCGHVAPCAPGGTRALGAVGGCGVEGGRGC